MSVTSTGFSSTSKMENDVLVAKNGGNLNANCSFHLGPQVGSYNKPFFSRNRKFKQDNASLVVAVDVVETISAPPFAKLSHI